MLVLTRKVGEKVLLRIPVEGEVKEVIVTVCKIGSSNQVKLGFDAALKIEIIREELKDTPPTTLKYGDRTFHAG